MPISLLSVNLSYPAPPLVLAVIGAFAVTLAFAAIMGASTTPRQRLLTAYALASTGPVVNIIGWLDVSAQNVRYLYMPALFVAILVAAALVNVRGAGVLLSAFALANLCCGIYNVWVYKVEFASGGKCNDEFCYFWQHDRGALVRVGGGAPRR